MFNAIALRKPEILRIQREIYVAVQEVSEIKTSSYLMIKA
jgi:hypothetical protein